MAMNTPNITNLQAWNLAIWKFNFIFRTFIVDVLLLCKDAVDVFYSLKPLGTKKGRRIKVFFFIIVDDELILYWVQNYNIF